MSGVAAHTCLVAAFPMLAHPGHTPVMSWLASNHTERVRALAVGFSQQRATALPLPHAWIDDAARQDGRHELDRIFTVWRLSC